MLMGEFFWILHPKGSYLKVTAPPVPGRTTEASRVNAMFTGVSHVMGDVSPLHHAPSPRRLHHHVLKGWKGHPHRARTRTATLLGSSTSCGKRIDGRRREGAGIAG